MGLDTIDRKLVNLVQKFPLVRQPYSELGEKLGISEAEVLRRIAGLRSEGIVRQISPVLDAACLGYQTTLVAMRVAEDKLAETERIISRHPSVSHGYERDNYYNVWFTMAASPGADIDGEVQRLASAVKCEAVFSLPAVKRFKIGAYFDVGGDGSTHDAVQPGSSSKDIALSDLDKLVVNELQQDLPLVSEPFNELAVRLNMDVEDFLRCARSLIERGVIRRFGAAVNHRRAGFKANAMTCWKVRANQVDAAGKELAALREVSHCYERKTTPQWQYNLYAMIHGQNRESCREVADRVSKRLGLGDPVQLFSTREFKKTRNRYPV